MRAWTLALVPLLAATPGDRLFAKTSTLLLQGPSDQARPIRQLLPGDELVWLDLPDDDLVAHKPPVGWIPVQTVDVPSERSFRGWIHSNAVTDSPLPAERRTAVLHGALTEAMDELQSRQRPFADLRGQVFAWREKAAKDPKAELEVQRLANQLAKYMDAEIAPRALDIQDALSELKDLNDPSYQALARRFSKLAVEFQP